MRQIFSALVIVLMTFGFAAGSEKEEQQWDRGLLELYYDSGLIYFHQWSGKCHKEIDFVHEKAKHKVPKTPFECNNVGFITDKESQEFRIVLYDTPYEREQQFSTYFMAKEATYEDKDGERVGKFSIESIGQNVEKESLKLLPMKGECVVHWSDTNFNEATKISCNAVQHFRGEKIYEQRFTVTDFEKHLDVLTYLRHDLQL